MKLLNEANLVYFSTCSSPSSMEGWLYKKGEVNKAFQKRWFVLKGNLLFYFDKPSDKDPNGVIILEGYTVELPEVTADPYTFQIIFKGATNARKYVLQAESHSVMERWMRQITCAGYDYMKIMVAELKAQLDELTALEMNSELAECRGQPNANRTVAIECKPQNQPAAESGTAAQKARFNPFDRAGKLDAFGQTPFDGQTATVVEPTSSDPVAPQRKKHKNSPTVRKKQAIKEDNRALGGVRPSQKTRFYTSPEESEAQVKVISKFAELHALYGGMIARLTNSTRMAGSKLVDV